MATKKQQVIQPRVSINNGKGVARLVREADPDGVVTEHQIAVSTRLVDLLYDQGQIGATQLHAATMLRNAFERSRVSIGRLGAVDPEAIGGSHHSDHLRLVEGVTADQAEGDEQALAWKEYKRCMQQMGQWWGILRHTTIEDRHPAEYGAKHHCHGYGHLRMALDQLARHFGLKTERRV